MSAQPNQVSVRMAVVKTQLEATAADVTKDSTLTPHRLNVSVSMLLLTYIVCSYCFLPHCSLTSLIRVQCQFSSVSVVSSLHLQLYS